MQEARVGPSDPRISCPAGNVRYVLVRPVLAASTERLGPTKIALQQYNDTPFTNDQECNFITTRTYPYRSTLYTKGVTDMVSKIVRLMTFHKVPRETIEAVKPGMWRCGPQY